jgi:N-acetylglucosamine-6-phosphate deacetylase
LTRSLLIRANRALTPHETITNAGILVSGHRIVVVGPVGTLQIPRGVSTVDCGELTLVPGFVDVHIHGSGGDTAMAGPEAIARISAFIARFGVTSWLPTLTFSAPPNVSLELICWCVESIRQPAAGAEPVGLHLEGPFLNSTRPGALRSDFFRSPTTSELDQLLDAGADCVRLMTVAPEVPGGLDVVRRLVARGVVASIGHSDASSDETAAAITAGVSHATHTFNAMRGFHQRDPGVVGAVLVSDAVRAELIADGIHVHPVAMAALIRAKGVGRVALITDAVAPAGLGDGDAEFDGRPIRIRDGRATLADGTIAGSVATFDAGLRRVVGECGVPLREAIAMASTTPARAIGVADRKGSLVGGHDADVVALDRDLRVRLTVARGEIVFRDM